MGEQLNIILVPHTHWDREWYQTFQQFRIRLVRTIDKLLDILDQDSTFSYFMLDGQTIVLDDYLEVQPEQEERIKRYTRAGRIQIGPWYLQPDEFLVSGESLIRNLQIGLARAAEFGKPMRIGYIPDSFGHIAQLPQILQGCGIDNAVLWRGVGAAAQQSEFYWSAPDGTRVLVIYLADPNGYSNARLMPLSTEDFATRVELLAVQILPKATTNTLLFMNGSDHLDPQEGLPTTIAAANKLLAHINPEHEKILARYGHPAHSKQFDSISVQIGTLPQYIEAIRQQNGLYSHEASERLQEEPLHLQTLTGEMRSSQYAHLLPAVLSTRMWIKQQNTATEHLLERWVEPLTAWAWKLGAPYPKGLVKLAWKYLLQNQPHDSICGCSIDQVHRENSVRFAQSQQVAEGVIAVAMQCIVAATDTRAPISLTHPSSTPVPIVVFNPAPAARTAVTQVVVQFPGSLRNAVIIDERGEHMPYTVVNRWRQEIGSMPLAREIIAAAVALMGADAPGALIQMVEGMIPTVLNQPEGAYGITRVHIDTVQQPGVAYIEVMITPRGRVTINDQELLAAEQQILALLKREDIVTLEVTVIDQARETIDFVAADLPAYGLKTFWMYPRGLKEEEHTAQQTTRKGTSHPVRAGSPYLASTTREPSVSVGAPLAGALELIAHPRGIENEWYRLEASADDGTLTVTDKLTGAVFTGLNRFVDGGDVGDLYTYCPPEHDLLVSKPLELPKIEVVSAGPVRATLRISGRWSFPSACASNRTERSSRVTVCPIVSEISLVPEARRIDISTSVENKVKDHRLRVIFPVSYTVGDAAAEGTFEVSRRPIAALRPADVAEWLEEPVNTFPQKRFVDVSNGRIGLGVLNRGLPEYEILPGGPGIPPGSMAVALTLLRCVEWLSRADLSTRRGHAGPMEHTPEAQCLGRSEFAYALVPHSGDWEAEEALVSREAQAFNTPVRTAVTEQHQGVLPSQATLLEVEPRELAVSAIKQSNDGKGLLVRVYNPLAHAVEASLRPGIACTQAFVANLLEEQQEQLFWSSEAGNGHLGGDPLYIGVPAGGIKTIIFQ